MEYQRIFTEKYANQLLIEAKDNSLLERYKEKKFSYDESKVLIIPRFEKPEGLVEALNPANDLESAITLYEAYQNLTPLQASNRTFWIYLAHADLYEYMRKRWTFEDMKTGADPSSFILTHWFFKNGTIENFLAGLWWSVKCSIDEDDHDNPYKYTAFLFRDIRVRMRLGKATLFRHNEAVIGITKFFMDNDELTHYAFQEKMLFATSHFNKLGAVKQLTFLDRDYFYNELVKIKTEISQITSDGRGRKKKTEYETYEDDNNSISSDNFETYNSNDDDLKNENVTTTDDDYSSISEYVSLFDKMSCSTKNNKKAPHKPLLLLSIFELIYENTITNNEFVLSNVIIERFKDNWTKYIKDDTFNCNVWAPINHLDGDGFYKLNRRSSILKFNISTSSMKQFNLLYKSIEIDHHLFELCKDTQTFNKLKSYLINRVNSSL